ncbi:MAG: esterase [Gammaproteobacteria bacterium]|nr:esterase [Gammaproteobacteria bacterium]
MLIYIHGFNSSPASFKAKLLQRYMSSIGMEQRLLIPELSAIPEKAISQLEALIRNPRLTNRFGANCPLSLIGSSLGGFYATWLAEKHDTRAVLINPAVRPYELLLDNLGENTNFYTQESYELTEEHIQQLHDLDVESITKPDRYLLMLQTGDDVLDYNQAIEKYSAVPSIVEEGGSHEFTGFDRHLKTVLAFCGINCLKTYS